ncbi:hypothetical protein [Streptosporangium sp. NPDC051022]|uniref:hypothetical protein n=1 Tax=Streptosporangium sp. NPDC051022 TaxID=3155752 RepID=UPI0034241CA1
MPELWGRRPHLLDRLAWWWTFRDVRATDMSLTASGGSVFLELHTPAWFKRCISAEVTPDELSLLAEQIGDILDDTPAEASADLSRFIDAMSPEERILALEYFAGRDRGDFLYAVREARKRYVRANGYRDDL